MTKQRDTRNFAAAPMVVTAADRSFFIHLLCTLLIAAWLYPASALAQWGPPPGIGGSPPMLARGPILISPPDGYRIPDNNGDDVQQRFRWRARTLPPAPYNFPYPKSESSHPDYRGPMPRIDPAYFGPQYAVCVYETVRCDRGPAKNQLFISAGSRTKAYVQLPSKAFQGRNFHWAVRACPPTMPWETFDPRGCVWSQSNRISWDQHLEPVVIPRVVVPPPPGSFIGPITQTLGTPCNLTVNTRPAALGTTVEFDWCSVEDADYYLLCISANENNLSGCEQDTNPQQGVFKPQGIGGSDWDRNLELATDFPAHTGSWGEPFYWKVAACRVDTQACGNWSPVAAGHWPAEP